MSVAPYPGLRPFERDETDIFFGREQHVDQLIERLGGTHFLAVVGSSGCGKSSLVRTGLLPNLEAGFLASANGQWHIAELRPSHQPMANLAQALSEHVFAQDAAVLQAQLWRGEFSLHELFAQSPLVEGANILLVVDQFEEIFRYYQQGDKNEAASFVKLLLASSRHPQVYVVMTMRSDFLGDCATFYGLPEAVNDGLYLTPRLTREQLSEAIALPVSVFDGEIEPALLNQLLNDAAHQQDQLPVVQHALMQMWWLAGEGNVICTAHYEQIGGLQNALSEHVDSVYFGLDAEQQRIAKVLFIQLTERVDIQRDTRRPMRLSAIAEQAGVDWEDVAEIVDIFRGQGRHFLIPPLGQDLDPNKVIDISHESLIRQWQQLKEWIEEETESAKLYLRLEDAAQRRKQIGAALWRSPDLNQAIDWKKEKQPTKQWASRYGNDFDLAMEFLDASEKDEKEATYAARVGLGLVGLMILIGFWLMFQLSLQQNETRIYQELKNKAEFDAFISQIEASSSHIISKLTYFLQPEESRPPTIEIERFLVKKMESQQYLNSSYIFEDNKKILIGVSKDIPRAFTKLQFTHLKSVKSVKKTLEDLNLYYFNLDGYSYLSTPNRDNFLFPTGESKERFYSSPNLPEHFFHHTLNYSGNLNNFLFEFKIVSKPDKRVISILVAQLIPTDKSKSYSVFFEFIIDENQDLFHVIKNQLNLFNDKPVYLPDGLEHYMSAYELVMNGNNDAEMIMNLFRKIKFLDKSTAQKLYIDILLEQGQKFAESGEIEQATMKYQQALQMDSNLEFNAETRAKQEYADILVNKGKTFAKEGKLDDAETRYKLALELNPELDFDAKTKSQKIYGNALINQGINLAVDGKIDDAITNYYKALSLNSEIEITASEWSKLCWYGSVNKQANKILEFCDKAIELKPEKKEYYKNRSVAKAQLGDMEGAIRDLTFYQDQIEKEQDVYSWLKSLKNGKNPFENLIPIVQYDFHENKVLDWGIELNYKPQEGDDKKDVYLILLGHEPK